MIYKNNHNNNLQQQQIKKNFAFKINQKTLFETCENPVSALPRKVSSCNTLFIYLFIFNFLWFGFYWVALKRAVY